MPRRGAAALLLVIFLSGARADDDGDDVPEIPRKEFAPDSSCRVVRVVECDTIVVMLAGKQARVGLIGVAAPSEPPARDMARDFVENLLLRESVYLDLESGWPEKDPSGRVWAYLYRAPDGLLVNLELVRRGYARIGASQPYKLDDAMRFYQARARIARKGIWARDAAEGGDSAEAGLRSRPSGGNVTTTRPAGDKTKRSGDGGTLGGQSGTGKGEAPGGVQSSSDASVMVWITKTGKRYHREGCEHLKKSKTPISVEDAKARGLEPCQTCEPPQ